MCKYNFKTYFVFNLHLYTFLSHMMFDEDELHTKVVVLDEINNFVVQTFYYLRSFGSPNMQHKIL